MTDEGVGAALRLVGTERAASGKIVICRWRLETAGAFDDLAKAIAGAYVNARQRWLHPAATVATRLPTTDSARKGDFGEILAAAL